MIRNTAERTADGRVDVDFSLAIHNRTGKYFIGLDLLGIADLPVGDVFYWHFARCLPPPGLAGRVIGRLQHWQIVGQTFGGPLEWIPRRKPRRPLLHLDPFTVPTTHLRRRDAVLCHDIGPVSHPMLFDAAIGRIYAEIYSQCEAIGPHMIFVSEATRTAYLSRYPATDPSRTRIVYPAIRPSLTTVEPVALPQIGGRFLLTVGSIGDRKNQQRCIAAFARSGLAEQGVSYVICGGKEPGFDAVERSARATPGVVLLAYVSDAALAWLYQNAKGFVLASLLEGFGMPVAEAISKGLLPLVSANSVLSEVAGDGALVTDPDDEASIASGMIALATMGADERRARLAMGQQSILRFSPDAIATAWHMAFDDILEMP